ncbi:MAG: hypothetical protein V1736_10810 [Pseudomonadota bacterium]
MDSIIKLLEEKYKLYVKLKEITASFKKALVDGDIKAVDIVSKQREKLIAAIDGVDQKLSSAGFRKGMRLAGESQKLMAGWIEKLKIALKEICIMHSECLAFAQARHKDLKQEILSMKKGARAVRGYAPQRQTVPRFIDTSK